MFEHLILRSLHKDMEAKWTTSHVAVSLYCSTNLHARSRVYRTLLDHNPLAENEALLYCTLQLQHCNVCAFVRAPSTSQRSYSNTIVYSTSIQRLLYQQYCIYCSTIVAIQSDIQCSNIEVYGVTNGCCTVFHRKSAHLVVGRHDVKALRREWAMMNNVHLYGEPASDDEIDEDRVPGGWSRDGQPQDWLCRCQRMVLYCVCLDTPSEMNDMRITHTVFGTLQ